MFENKYNDVTIALANLALKLTGATEDEIRKVWTGQGDGGLLKLISEKCKDFVTKDELQAAIAALKEELTTTEPAGAEEEPADTEDDPPADGENNAET